MGRQSAGNIVKEESGFCLWLSLVCREVVEDVLLGVCCRGRRIADRRINDSVVVEMQDEKALDIAVRV